jgi:hypothetical protein
MCGRYVPNDHGAKQHQNISSHHIMNNPNTTITSTGTTAVNPGLLSRASAPEVVSDFEAKTYLKAISVELKQLSFVTSSTSSGSAKVMSTHYAVSQSVLIPNAITHEGQTKKKWP